MTNRQKLLTINLKSLEGFMSFDEVMIQCAAPSICGIKPANLFSLHGEKFCESRFNWWENEYKKIGLKVSLMKNDEGLIRFFVYDLVWERKLLGDCLIRAYLAGKNYPVERGTQEVLNELFKRLCFEEKFPHEVGVFLGYPLEDVIAFESGEGADCKFCGYWKVFGNVENSRKLCESYHKCSLLCKKWFEEGQKLLQIVTEYKRAVEIAA